MKTPLYTVPTASTSFTKEAFLDESEYPPAIRFHYIDEDDGLEYEGGIFFEGMCAVRLRAERCSTAWHIEGAYDTLVEVLDSPWVEEIRRDTAENHRYRWKMHHYMIYFDSAGTFEVIADSWQVLPRRLLERA